jgi:hypothetical protein
VYVTIATIGVQCATICWASENSADLPSTKACGFFEYVHKDAMVSAMLTAKLDVVEGRVPEETYVQVA